MKNQSLFRFTSMLGLSVLAVSNASAQSSLDKVLSFGLPALVLMGIIFFSLMFFVSRYKRCPSDKILVIYGKTGSGSAKCIHGGAAFIWPVIQDYKYLDLQPMSIDVNLQDALSKQNIRVSVPAQFTVAIGNEPSLMQAAAERLLAMERQNVRSLAQDIIMGQMRLVIANMDIEELNTDRDKFVTSVYSNVGKELHKIGLDLINVNVTDIHDESGYIKALGQEAAAKAINEAKVKVAKENKLGAIGDATETQERRVKVADAESRATIGEKQAEAEATKGKNIADVEIAQSDAERRQRVAEANKNAEVSEKTAEAEAQKAAYVAQTQAEEARKERELAARRANEVVQSQIEKEKTVINAQAESEQKRTIAEGEASAILANYKAQAEGIQKVLDAQAEGFKRLVEAAGGNAQAAIGLLMVDKVEKIAAIQASAIKDIKFDKITVFDGGGGESTAGFISSLFKAVPALNEFMGQSGLSLPEYLAKGKAEDKGDQSEQ